MACTALLRLSSFSGLFRQLWQLQAKQYCPEAKHSQYSFRQRELRQLHLRPWFAAGDFSLRPLYGDGFVKSSGGIVKSAGSAMREVAMELGGPLEFVLSGGTLLGAAPPGTTLGSCGKKGARVCGKLAEKTKKR